MSLGGCHVLAASAESRSDRGMSARQGTAHVDESVVDGAPVRRSDGSPLRVAHQILAWMLTDLAGETVAIGSVSLLVTVPRSAGPTRPSQVTIGPLCTLAATTSLLASLISIPQSALLCRDARRHWR